MSGLIFLLICLPVVILVGQIWLWKKQLHRINTVLDQILEGNVNQRVRLQRGAREFKEMSGGINRIMDNFQNNLERVQYLEEARKQLISNISHDLRTPLTAMLGYVELLQTDKSLSEQEKERYLTIVAQRGNLLYKLLQEFFEFAKLEAQDVLQKFEKLDVGEKVVEVLASFYHEFEKAGITPSIEVPASPVYVYADASSTERILTNLLSNSLRYGVDGGRIGVKVYEVAGKVWVEIWDNGKGISSEDMAHIFERLYTGETSRNISLQGSGLGLAITKMLIEKQNGEIFAESKPYERTAFSFYLQKVE